MTKQSITPALFPLQISFPTCPSLEDQAFFVLFILLFLIYAPTAAEH